MKLKPGKKKLLLVWFWFIFTVALAIWQFVFVTHLLSHLLASTTLPQDQLLRQMKMVSSEMITLIVSLVVGGLYLINLIKNERERAQQLKQFFATFTHEIKTSLSSLVLQTDSLDFSNASESQKKISKRLFSEIAKLENQLENSLFLAQQDQQQFFLEELSLERLLEPFQHSDRIAISLSNKSFIIADSRASESIIRNIVQNAISHGRASQLEVSCTPSPTPHKVLITFKDNGIGFSGDVKQLNKAFVRHNPKSGSGIGLYLITTLSKLMDAKVTCASDNTGFSVTLEIKGRLA